MPLGIRKVRTTKETLIDNLERHASLLELESDLQDYVITHELLHYHTPNHGKLWKSLMRAHLGDYEPLERELRRMAGDREMLPRAFARR